MDRILFYVLVCFTTTGLGEAVVLILILWLVRLRFAFATAASFEDSATDSVEN